MAYDRGTNRPTQSNNQQSGGGRRGGGGYAPRPSGQSRPANNQSSSQSRPQSSTGSDSPRSAKPDHSMALRERDAQGKWVTAKGEDGKTIYVGSGWTNTWQDGEQTINFVIDRDLRAGDRVVVYKRDPSRSGNGSQQGGGR